MYAECAGSDLAGYVKSEKKILSKSGYEKGRPNAGA
jgi:hypothetical protein